jgi:hypothetical protein
VLLHARAAAMQVDPKSLPGTYTTPRDRSIDGGKSKAAVITRALGWLDREPMISQRVVHDTALVLDDLAARR